MLLEAAAIAAPLIGGAMDWLGGSRANASNAAQAQKQMDFQERMSNSAYQRAVADMRKAGLNPALAYGQGGAHSPSGASAQMHNTLAGAGNSASQAAQSFANVRNTAAAREHQLAITENTRAQTEQLKLESAHRVLELKSRARELATNANLAEATYGNRFKKVLRDEARETIAFDNEKLDSKFLAESYGMRMEQLRKAIDLTVAHAGEANARTLLSQLAVPEALNNARAQGSWWKKTVAPYLNDASKISSGIVSGVVGGVIGRRTGGPRGSSKELKRRDSSSRSRKDVERQTKKDWDWLESTRRWREAP